jgi:hypothetical protein
MKEHRAIALIAFLAIAFAGTTAAADETTAQVKNNPGGYEYVFGDNPLSAEGLGPIGAQIAVRARAMRETLIRPRTQFVVEMLKSVEKL